MNIEYMTHPCQHLNWKPYKVCLDFACKHKKLDSCKEIFKETETNKDASEGNAKGKTFSSDILNT